MRFLILGCGNIGKVIIKDLLVSEATKRVIALDISEKRLREMKDELQDERFEYIVGDATNRDYLKSITANIDVVINSLPGSIGFHVMKNIIELGTNLVDISYMPENPLELDELAKNKRIIVVPDAGVAPGLSNILVGYASAIFDRVESVKIYVGGLPEKKIPPLDYCLTWSAEDLIEEYTRPARIIRNGELISVPALSGLERIYINGVGELEAFYTDGLRTLLHTIRAKNMEEKTLRYPGHVEKIRLLIDLGFFDKDRIKIDDNEVSIMKITAKLLERKISCKDVRDIVILKVITEGVLRNEKTRRVFEIIDRYRNGITAMGRTTGFTASIIAQLIAKGRIDMYGVVPPEYLGMRREIFHQIINELSRRGVLIRGISEEE